MTLDILKVIVQVGLIPDLSVFSDVLEVVVDTSVYLPGMCTISFEERLPEGGVIFEHIDNMLKYKIGEKVIVSAFTDSLRNKGIPDANIIFTGEVTSIEPVFEKSGKAILRIRAFDKGHRLTKGKKFRTFQMMNDMLIIQKIALEAALPATVVSPRLTTMYTHVIQYDQSDWDFLWDRAQLFGCQMFVDHLGILHFETAGMVHGAPIELSWGKALVQFEPRLVSMGQVTEAAVGGWDSTLNMKISAKMPGASSVPMNIIGNALTGPMTEVMASFPKSTDYSVDNPMHNVAQAIQVAGALVDEHANQFIRASGEVNTCIPGLVAGSKVLVTNVGIRFTGTYYVSEAKHIYRNGDYRILFQVSGQNPYTIRHLINGNDLDRNKINGVVIGIVTNNQDPLMSGRVKVKYPWIPSTTDIEGDWARIASIGGGAGGGLMFLPEVNDEVLVTFEHGDINFPYIVGVLWNGKNIPPQGKSAVAGGKVNQRVIRSRSGHTVIFDDTMGKEQIIIQDKTGNNSITIDSTMNAMTIKAQGDLKIEAGGKLTLTSNMDFSVDTKTKGTISAATSIEVKGNTGAKMAAGASSLDLQAATAALKSVKVDVTADAAASLKGNAMVEIQGGIVKIN